MRRSRNALKGVLCVAAALLCGTAGAFDANGVALGAREADLKKAFPGARCKALEWRSDAADRRCDDSQVGIGEIVGRITFYLKNDAVQAFDVRFETRDFERMSGFLKSRYGPPGGEGRESIQRKGGKPREIHTLRWEAGGDRAVLTAQLDRSRAALSVARGDFDEEIYRIR